MNLNNFLNPKYIAVIGASSNKEKVGRKVFDNILENRKTGVFPINYNDKKIAGIKAYSDIGLIPLKNWSDLLVMIVVPAKLVVAEVEKCAHLGVKNIVIISAGFKEIGKKGKELEDDIKRIAQKNNINILGPNCLGFINTSNSLNATFSNYHSALTKIDKKNNIAFLSQSGAIGSAVLDWLIGKNIGLSYFISLGNKAVLNENDFFEFFLHDKKTDLVIVYLEEISQGPKFLELVSKLAKIKPVAILKSGRTAIGGQMASSHTGSLAGSYNVTLAALSRSGAIILDNIDEIYNLMRLVKGPINNISKTKGDLAIISNAGGLSVIAADEIFTKKIIPAVLEKNTVIKLKKELPEFASIKNPLDILGDADPNRYKKSLEIVLNDKNVSSVLVLLTPQSMTKVKETAEVIGQLKKQYPNKLISTCFLGGAEVAKGKSILADYLVPNFDSVEEAIIILGKFLEYLKNKKDIKIFNSNNINSNNNLSKSKLMVPLSTPHLMDYIKSFKLLKKYKIDVVAPKKIDKNNLNSIKYPVAVKFVGPDFIHKTDKQAIFLNVKNKSEIEIIIKKFNAQVYNKKISSVNYIVYQPMITGKLELILGLKRDPVFGPIILLGLGGVYTEVYKDTVLELADLDKNQVLTMIKKLKIYPILAGTRGQAGVDMAKLVKVILNFSKLIQTNKNILEIDINPLVVDSKKIIALDVRVLSV